MFKYLKYKKKNTLIKMQSSIKKSRSKKIKKYATVYNSYIKKNNEKQNNEKKSPRKTRQNQNYTKQQNTVKKIPLNSYQKFVQTESKKQKYKNLAGKDRLRLIANDWKINK